MTLWAVFPLTPVIPAETAASSAQELQRAMAAKCIPELIVFVSLAAALALGLKSKSDDLIKLRKEKYFMGPDEPFRGSS